MKQEITVLQPERVPHHKIASLHRDMNDMEFESLKLNIETNGQLFPIITYKGKLVDGRHRQRALIELGIHDMTAIALPGNISLQDVKARVIGTEMRRSDNVAQKAIRAFRWMSEEAGRSQADTAVKFGLPQPRISEVKKLNDVVGANTLNKFYKNGYLMYGGKKYTQMAHVIKYMSTEEEEQIDRPATSEEVKQIVEALNRMKNREDIVGVAQIEAHAKRLRLKEI